MSKNTFSARHRAVPARINPFVTASRAVTMSASVAGKPAAVVVAASGLMLGAALPASAAGELTTAPVAPQAATSGVYTVTEWDANGTRTYTTDQWGVPAAAATQWAAPAATQWAAPAATTYASAATYAPAAPVAAPAAATSAYSLQSTNKPVVRQSSMSGIAGTAMQGEGQGYDYGNTGFGTWDCSSFVQWVYAQHGIDMPRVSWDQIASMTPTSNPQPGDLVSQNGGGHVGIYLGNGQMISALNKAQGTVVHSVNAMALDGYYTR